MCAFSSRTAALKDKTKKSCRTAHGASCSSLLSSVFSSSVFLLLAPPPQQPRTQQQTRQRTGWLGNGGPVEIRAAGGEIPLATC